VRRRDPLGEARGLDEASEREGRAEEGEERRDDVHERAQRCAEGDVQRGGGDEHAGRPSVAREGGEHGDGDECENEVDGKHT